MGNDERGRFMDAMLDNSLVRPLNLMIEFFFFPKG